MLAASWKPSRVFDRRQHKRSEGAALVAAPSDRSQALELLQSVVLSEALNIIRLRISNSICAPFWAVFVVLS